MPPKHRFHQAGVGSRTGMRPPSSAANLADFLSAGKAAMDNPAYGDDDDDDDDEADQESDQEDSQVDAYEERSRLSSRKGRPSGKGSSSRIDDSNMDVAHTSGISPRSYIRSARASEAGSIVDHGSPVQRGSSSSRKARRSGYDEELADLDDGPSFELSAMAGDDLDVFSEPDSYHASPPKRIRAPAAGLAARKAAQQKANNASSSSTSSSAGRRSKKAAQQEEQEEVEQSYDDLPPLDDVSADAVEVVIESDVGEEALEGTTAGASDRAQVRKGLKVAPPAAAKRPRGRPPGSGKARAKAADAPAAAKKPRGRPKKQPAAAAEPDDSVSDAAPPLLIEKRTIKKGKAAAARRGPASVQHQVVERVPSSVQRGDRGASVESDSGLRRGTRYRYGPLEYWRGEHARFGRASLPQVREDEIDDDEFESAPKKSYGAPPVPVLKEVVRVPRAEDEGTFSGMKRIKKPTLSRRPAKRAKNSAEEEDVYMDPTAPTVHPEDGWDNDTNQMGEVWDAETGEQVERRIVCTAAQARPRTAVNSKFAFEKVFGVDEFMAAGVLEIPVGGSKPVKPTRDNNYVFVVIEGAVLVCVHRTQFHLAPGGIFLVPKGNTYSLQNVSQRKVRLFFSQAKNGAHELIPSPAEAATGTSPGPNSGGAESSFGEMTFSQPARGGKRKVVDESFAEEEEEN